MSGTQSAEISKISQALKERRKTKVEQKAKPNAGASSSTNPSKVEIPEGLDYGDLNATYAIDEDAPLFKVNEDQLEATYLKVTSRPINNSAKYRPIGFAFDVVPLNLANLRKLKSHLAGKKLPLNVSLLIDDLEHQPQVSTPAIPDSLIDFDEDRSAELIAHNFLMYMTAACRAIDNYAAGAATTGRTMLETQRDNKYKAKAIALLIKIQDDVEVVKSADVDKVMDVLNKFKTLHSKASAIKQEIWEILKSFHVIKGKALPTTEEGKVALLAKEFSTLWRIAVTTGMEDNAPVKM